MTTTTNTTTTNNNSINNNNNNNNSINNNNNNNNNNRQRTTTTYTNNNNNNKRETKRMWNIRIIKVIPVVVAALGSTSKKLKKCIELAVAISTALLQKTALLGTARKLRKVLDCR